MGGVIGVLLVAVLALGNLAAAQQALGLHTLAGAVTVAPSGTPLPGVTVDLSRPGEPNTVRTVVTDGSGHYRIEKVLPGRYVLSMRLAGYGSAIRDVEIGGGSVEFEYDVQLRPVRTDGGVAAAEPNAGRRVICGMTVITPTPAFDPGIQTPRKPPTGTPPAQPTIRAIQPTLCWEPSTGLPQVPPTR